jgi:hypothetical protein
MGAPATFIDTTVGARVGVARWSATTSAEGAFNAWAALFFNGNVALDARSLVGAVWCVRGGQGVDPQ